MITFHEYLSESLKGVITNQFLMGIYLSAIVFVLRDHWKKLLNKFNNRNKVILEIFFFIFIIPASLIVLMFFIFVLWLISFF